jgi:methyl-accepting chemotaxis protein
MPNTLQHNSLVDLANNQLSASKELANAIFSGFEKIDHALVDVAHQMLDAQRKFGSVAADMRDQSRMVELQESVLCRPDKAMQCHQQIMSAMIEIQTEIGRSTREYFDRLSELSRGQLQRLAKQSEFRREKSQVQHLEAGNPFAGMLSVWRDTFQEARQVMAETMASAQNGAEHISEATDELAHRSMEVAQGTHSRSISSHKRQMSEQRKN